MDGTRIYLIRHGETELNASGRCQGQSDSHLSAAGVAQIAALETELADVEFDAAYTSPLGRARRTAHGILSARGLRAASIAELAELSYGDLQGSRFDEWPIGLHEQWKADPWSVAFPNGESLAMVRARVIPVFHAIVAAHAGETVLISAHGHVNRVILLDALDLAPTDFWRLTQENGTVTIIDAFPRAAA